MENKSPSEKIYRQVLETDTKDYYSLRELNNKINKVPNDYSYRKILKDFKKACELQGENPESFRKGRDYKIPKSQETLWSMLLSHDEVLKANPKPEGIYEFALDMIDKKNELEKRLFDDENSLSDPYLVDDLAALGETICDSDAKDIFFWTYEQKLIEMIQRDFKYIRDRVPEDRYVIYAELYMERVEKAKEFVINLAKAKIWEDNK